MTGPHGDQGLPVVLILGGTTTLARPLAKYLLAGFSRRAAFVRIADRFSVTPATTYLDKPFLELLQDPTVPLEYKQVNLGNPATHRSVFVPPSAWGGRPVPCQHQGFDVVYDLTGDTAFDKPELLQISNTYQLALGLAKSAVALESPPKAYVRLTYSFYEMKPLPASSSSSSTSSAAAMPAGTSAGHTSPRASAASVGNTPAGYTETAELRPDGVRGRWWHETLRALGSIPGLPFAVVRCGAWYGPGTWEGEVMPRVMAGHIYRYLKQDMKFLYNSDLRIHTIHSDDVAQALHLVAGHVMATPREMVSEQSGVPLSYSFAPGPASSSSAFSFSLSVPKRLATDISDAWKTVDTVVPQDTRVVVPLFNVVDDNDSTQETLARAVAGVWGVKYGFLNSAVAALVQQFAKADFSEMIDDVNEMHVDAWSKMLAASDPPVTSTPISPFLNEHAFRKMAICLDGSKIKRLGFQPLHPRVEVDELVAIVKGFQDDGLWWVGVLSRLRSP